MGTNEQAVEQFRSLHEVGFVMPNAWDGLSACMFRAAGFQATATSSAALALSLGRLDGQHQVTRDEHLTHATLLAEISGLPVNGDLEDGYGETPDDVADTVLAAAVAGLAGLGIEDTTGNPDQPIRDFDDAVARVEAAVGAAAGRIVITGRTDNYLHGRQDLDDTIRRLVAFAEVGADVLYAPFPPDMNSIRAIVSAVAPKPVNVVIGPARDAATVQELFDAGVKRISLGVSPYLRAMQGLADGIQLLQTGDVAGASTGLPMSNAIKALT